MSDRELELLRIELKVAERQIQHWREHAQACQQGGEILKQELDRLRDQLQQLEWALSSAQDRADIAVRERDEARTLLTRAVCICSHKDFRPPCGWCQKRTELLGPKEAKDPAE